MGKDKLRKFRENETFICLLQPATSEVLGCDHPIKGNWGREMFGNDNPIVLELGCGKGDFAVGMAAKYTDYNWIAMERVPDVACLALEKAMNALDNLSPLKTLQRGYFALTVADKSVTSVRGLKVGDVIKGQGADGTFESQVTSVIVGEQQ